MKVIVKSYAILLRLILVNKVTWQEGESNHVKTVKEESD